MPRFACSVLLSGLALAAQSTLTTSYATNYHLASLDGAVYFDLVVAAELQVTGFDLNLLSPAGSAGRVDVHLRPGGWQGHLDGPGDWVRLAGAPVVAAGPGRPTALALGAPLGLPPGHYGVALHLQGVMPLYSFAFGPRAFGNGELSLVAGASSLRPFDGAPFAYRVFSGAVHYLPGGGPHTVATAQPVGAGCGAAAAAGYEFFAAGDLDLAPRRLRLRPNAAGGYDVAARPPLPVAVPPGAVDLGLGPRGAAFVALPAPLPFPGGSTSVLRVHANGWVALTDEGELAPGPAAPGPQLLFAAHAVVAVAAMDLEPTPAANVHAHVDPATAVTTIVWAGVPARGGGPGQWFALHAHPDGTLDLDYAAVANPFGSCLVGFGGGRGAIDPGPRDLSAGPFATAADDPGLGLRLRGRPVPGTAGELGATGLPPAAAGTAFLFGWQPVLPGFDLGGFGAPGCRLHVEPSGMVGCVAGPGAALPVAWPADPGLLGAACAVQAAAWDHAGALRTSAALWLGFGAV